MKNKVLMSLRVLVGISILLYVLATLQIGDPSVYSGKSIFANSPDLSIGKPDEVDDGDALCGYVRRLAQANAAVIETFDVKTPYLEFGFEVGDIVMNSPESRDVFGVYKDNRSICVIEKVRMNFEKQYTELKVVRKRKVEL